MRKTFLKVALIGALAVAMPSTFTSCKDYDTDIENLTSAQDALKAQLGTLQTAIATAQSAADAAASQAKAAASQANEALTKAAAATAAAEKAKADAIAEATKQVEALAAKSATKEDLEKLGSQIAAIDENLNKLTETVDENTKNIAALQLQMKTLEGFQTILGPLVENFGTPEKVEALMKDLQSARELVEQLNNALPEGTSLAELVQSISKISPNLVTLSSTVAAMPTHAELVYAKQIYIPSLNVNATQISGYWDYKYDDATGEFLGRYWVVNDAYTYIQNGVDQNNRPLWTWTNNETGYPTYKGYTTGDWYSLTTTNVELSLGYATAASDYEFGKNERPATTFNQTIANPVKFEKGKQLVFDDAVMIRVTPTNAVITPEMISLINTQVGDLSEFIAVSNVERYEGLMTRGAKENGLWTITFTLKPGYDQEAFAAATTTKQGKQILYAVAINHQPTKNEAVDADFADRAVTTAYDITINDQAKAPAYALDYFVDNTRVSSIHNRYEYANERDETNGYPSLVYATNAVTNPANNMLAVYDKAQVVPNGTAGYAWVGDYTWGLNKDTKKIQYQIADGSAWISGTPYISYVYNNAQYYLDATYNDDRQNYGYYDVEVGKPFTVTIPYSNAYAFYVALDLDRAIVSNGSELNAWESYVGKIDGLNTITTEGSIDLTITEAAKVAQGEVIGFRVWAVNFDGTLIDPDGRAFYVQVGQEQAASTSITANITAPRLDINPGTNNVNLLNVVSALGDWTNQPYVNVKFTMNANANPSTNTNVSVKFGDGSTVAANGGSIRLTRNNVTGANADYNQYFKNMNVVLGNYQFVDGKAYNGTLTITDNSGLVLQTIAVSVTKNLPAGIPAGITPIAGQISNNEGTAYVTARSFDFATMFNNLTTAYATATGTGTATIGMKSGNDAFGTVTGTTVALPANWKGAEYVNKGTQFTLELGFNYGAISLPAKGQAMKDVTRKTTYSIDFATQANTINFAWAGTAPSLVDGQAKEVSTDNITLSSIFKKFNGTLTAAMVDGNIQNVSVEVKGDLAKYFSASITAPTNKTVGNTKTDGKITFTPVPGTNPTTSTVTGKVEITYYDANSTVFKSVKTLTIQMD